MEREVLDKLFEVEDKGWYGAARLVVGDACNAFEKATGLTGVEVFFEQLFALILRSPLRDYFKITACPAEGA